MSTQVRTSPALDVTWPAGAGGYDLEGLLAAALDDLGITAVHESPGSWRVFFPSRHSRDRAALVLDSTFHRRGVTVAALDVPGDDWAKRSQADLSPISAGQFVVAPPWRVPPPSERGGALLVVIEPSMGFGTGHHATTRLCLRALGLLELEGRPFLDVGTGSGILAIAACLLGAAPVVAVDTDPDAIESARANLRLNGVADGVRLVTADFRAARGLRAAAVAANLTGGALIRGCEALAGLADAGGALVVSGFTREEAADVHAAFSRIGQIAAANEEDGWCAATVRVTSASRTGHE